MSSTRKTFECFVHLYDIKYKITLSEVTHGYILFEQLYREIQKIDHKQDISFETNTFEILDKKNDRFQRITSFSQVIDDNSRVRVLIKPQLFKNYLSNTSDKNMDVLNSYQTSNHFPTQTIESKDKHFADYFDGISNKSKFSSSTSQIDDRCWTPSNQYLNLLSAPTGQPTSPSLGPLVSPSMGSSVEPSMSYSRNLPSMSGYCPKIVEYDNSSNFNRTPSSELSQDNDYQFSASNPSEISSVIDKLMKNQNQLLKEKTLEDLRKEGIEMKENFNFEIYFCKVCDEVFQSPESALTHSRSIDHSERKLGIFADDLDRSLIIPTENLADINVVLARKQELKKLDTRAKYEFRRHGIRIKDGIGVNAYVCLECKMSFMSYNYVKHHLEKFKVPEAGSDVVYSSNTFYPGSQSSNAFTPVVPRRSSMTIRSDHRPDSAKNSESNSRKRRRRRNRKKTNERDQSDHNDGPSAKRDRRDGSSDEDKPGRSGDNRDREDIAALRCEGIREKDMKNRGIKFVCQLCDRLLADKSLAIHHVTSDEHIGNKTGETLKGVERLFIVDCDQTSIEYFLARKRQLRDISFNAMEQFVYHGIRLKNGMGDDAFLCLTCNQALADIQTIENHMEFLDVHRNIKIADMSGQTEAAAQLAKLSRRELDAIFSNEGIKRDIKISDNKGTERLVCVFCDTTFKSEESVITHLSRPYHHKTKRAQVLPPIDALFVVPSDRSDEFDVAYARVQALSSYSNQRKIKYSEEGIRLRDGRGPQAYGCLKCQALIAADSLHSAVSNINKHIDSQTHIERITTYLS